MPVPEARSVVNLRGAGLNRGNAGTTAGKGNVAAASIACIKAMEAWPVLSTVEGPDSWLTRAAMEVGPATLAPGGVLEPWSRSDAIVMRR